MGIPNHITVNPPTVSLFAPDALATNTLILANLPPQAFENEGSAVREVLERFGRVVRLSLLKSFLRVVAVFDSTADSSHAKDALHMVEFLGRELRVYFGDHTDTTHLSNPSAQPLNFLRVPEPEKNFLLSPPGSPPVGWVQLRESSPVSGGHDDALLDALRELERDEGAEGMEFVLDEGSAVEMEIESEERMEKDYFSAHTQSGSEEGVQVLRFGNGFAAGQGEGGLSLPMIVVENIEISGRWGGGLAARPSTPLPKTAMPPMIGV